MPSTQALQRLEKYLKNINATNAFVNAFTNAADHQELIKQATNATNPVFYAVKDTFCTKDLPTTCASQMLSKYKSPYESRVTELIKNNGHGIIIGKTNMDEFAMGSNNYFSHFGPTRNPRYEEPTSAGGSSGGSAAAVAAEYCDVAVGTDTGGSVRLPAAYCSVYGFKPSYGLISRHGLVSYAQSLDTVGIFGRDVASIKSTFDILNHPDERDPSCARAGLRARTSKERHNLSCKLRIGVVEEAILEMADPVRLAWAQCLENIEKRGHSVEFVSVPNFKYSLHTYYTIAPSEASSNLARYDGIRYGHRATTDRAEENEPLYAESREEGFGGEVKRRILLGTYNLSSKAFDKHFLTAQKVRGALIQQFNGVFSMKNMLLPLYSEKGPGNIDLLVHPTAQSLPHALAELDDKDPLEGYTNDVLTVPASLAGLPAISIPYGLSVGMQIWGQYGDDELVLDFANQLALK